MSDESERVLMMAPRGRDAELMKVLLDNHGFAATVCTTADELVIEIERAAGCVLLTREALDSALQVKLARSFGKQPAWSDFPLIVLVDPGSGNASQVLAVELGNVSVLERPLVPHILLTAVKSALRGRRRQYAARAAIQQRDQFLAMLGHELRNPLAAIVLATQLVRSGTDRTQFESRLELIERQSKLLARLVDDLLDVARVTSGKVRLRHDPVNVDDTIKSSIAALVDRARMRGVSVVFASTSGAVIEGDAVRIEQVINNLVSNAIKYSPSGRTVMVSSAIEGDLCTIRVRDQGIGIAPEMQSRVFELFTQADGSLERAEGGMGIGLTLVDRLVRLHGGTVQVISDGVGHGTELVVQLPRGKPPTHPNVIKLEPAQPARLRVVLVEDNADLRELTAELLEALGCSVELAVDGQEGVARIIESKPDLALVDIGLPILDGYAVAREVRKQLGDTVTLVAASGYGTEQDRDEAQRAGFDQHVTKPMDASAIRGILELVQQHRDARTARSATTGH